MRPFARVLCLALLATTALGGPARGWSSDIHGAICEMAWDLVSPDTREFVLEVRRDARRAKLKSAGDFAASCSWPDDSRHNTHLATYENHWLNVTPDFADRVVPERDCPAYDCAPLAIIRFTSYLAEPATSDRERRRRATALRFVGHFVADLHQPLHAGQRDDRGGNTLLVHWLDTAKSARLHSLWDGPIGERAGFGEDTHASRMARQISDRQRQAWRSLDPWQWADESYQLAKTYAYSHPSGARVKNGDHLRQDYLDAAATTARTRILEAAVRLADLLDTVAAGVNPYAPADDQPSASQPADD